MPREMYNDYKTFSFDWHITCCILVDCSNVFLVIYSIGKIYPTYSIATFSIATYFVSFYCEDLSSNSFLCDFLFSWGPTIYRQGGWRSRIFKNDSQRVLFLLYIDTYRTYYMYHMVRVYVLYLKYIIFVRSQNQISSPYLKYSICIVSEVYYFCIWSILFLLLLSEP